ncbi:MAG TPA: ketopantoate reductase family protein [Verrucomicrobiae bacterium]|nr:ketopantoate reductase family protein [Verrucomicrobiae bacterium]
MKITVLGAGAVGGYFGGRLAEAGLDVTFLVRERRAEQLNKTGLVIKSSQGDLVLSNPKIVTTVEDIPACDLVLFTVKNYHLADSLGTLKALVAKGAKVLPLLNGVEHFDLLAQALGAENVLGGICHIIATLDSEGGVVHAGPLHNISFGPLQPEQQEFCRSFQAAASTAKLKIALSSNVREDIWNKYAFITAFSGITTASRLSIDKVIATEPTREVYRQVLNEMVALAAAKGVKLPESFANDTVERMHKMAPGSTSSMHQDFRKGLWLEVESLQGAAVRLGKEAGLEMPAVFTLYGLLKPYEHGSEV